MDPAAYLRHVGLPAQGWTPTVAALGRLHRAHVDAIPFTSVTTALGRVPALDLPTLERRMVAERRGGYCLEHVTLFAAVLDALGFAPQVRLCRVGDPAEVAPGPSADAPHRARPAERRPPPLDGGRRLRRRGPRARPGPGVAGEGDPVRHGSWEHRATRSTTAASCCSSATATGGGRCTRRSTATSTTTRSGRRTAGSRCSPGSPFAGGSRDAHDGRPARAARRHAPRARAAPTAEVDDRELTPAAAVERSGAVRRGGRRRGPRRARARARRRERADRGAHDGRDHAPRRHAARAPRRRRRRPTSWRAGSPRRPTRSARRSRASSPPGSWSAAARAATGTA